MASPFLNERIHVFTPQLTVENIKASLAIDYPFIFNDWRVSHEFISWGMKKSFRDITGIPPDGFRENINHQSIYGGCRFLFESFMLSVVRDLGFKNVQEHFSFNLVLTHERLYIISY